MIAKEHVSIIILATPGGKYGSSNCTYQDQKEAPRRKEGSGRSAPFCVRRKGKPCPLGVTRLNLLFVVSGIKLPLIVVTDIGQS
jgi:hypothetical protein